MTEEHIRLYSDRPGGRLLRRQALENPERLLKSAERHEQLAEREPYPFAHQYRRHAALLRQAYAYITECRARGVEPDLAGRKP